MHSRMHTSDEACHTISELKRTGMLIMSVQYLCFGGRKSQEAERNEAPDQIVRLTTLFTLARKVMDSP